MQSNGKKDGIVIGGRGVFRPELPAEMRRLERLSGVLSYRIFEHVEHYSGLSNLQVAALLDVSPGRLIETVAQLNQGDNEKMIAARWPDTARPQERMKMLTVTP